MICFSTVEITTLLKRSMMVYLRQALDELNYSLNDLRIDYKKMGIVMDRAMNKNMRNKENIEIFVALDSCLSFHKTGSKICFVLKDSLDPNKITINTLDDFKSFTKENDITDFAIMSNDGLRLFQIKQYQEALTTECLFRYIKTKLQDYGNVLGSVNLLIILQGNKTDTSVIKQMDVNFQALHKKVQDLNLSFTGQILIEYNEKNEYSVINQVYPDLKSMKKGIERNFLTGSDLSAEAG